MGLAISRNLALAQALERLFVAPVVVSIATPEMADRPLFPVEAKLVERAVPKRRREFSLGRAVAREALSRLGAPILPIPAQDRAPRWPTGFVGSITHCQDFCAAVAGLGEDVRALGFDAESAAPLEPGVARIVCSAQEVAAFAALPEFTTETWGKLAFSAKEAFYKCFHSETRRFLDFLEVEVSFAANGDIASTSGEFRVRLCDESGPEAALAAAIVGRWHIDAERVYCGATLSHDV